MDRDAVKTAIRFLRKPEDDGLDVCVICGCRDRLQLHHVNGRRHDATFKIPVCARCHALLTEAQLRERVNMRFERKPNLRVAHSLDSQAALFEVLAEAKRRAASRQLDEAAYFGNFADAQRRLAELLRGESQK